MMLRRAASTPPPPFARPGVPSLASALLLTLLVTGAGHARPAEPPAPAATLRAVDLTSRDPFPSPVYEVRMEAELDPETRTIHGVERLRWRNTASVPVDELVFHLYLNAFANDRTTFMRESGGSMRGAELREGRWGWIEVRSMKTAGGADLAAGEEFLRPDDPSEDDRTLARYPLPEPLAPGAWITVEIEFESRLPHPFARTGYHEGYVLAGQWFPKIAVFEDAGTGGRAEAGWDAHQFHAQTEFFADFGDYDVTLTLPERYLGKIGATGAQVAESVADGKVEVRFVQRGVHDFGWTADPDFLVFRATFEPARDVPEERARRILEPLGLSREDAALSPVRIDLFLQPEHRSQAGRYLEAAKVALAGYGLRLGAYPYETLTLVDPASGALGSGGMEYPTLVTLATHPLLDVPGFRGVLAPEIVTVHEVGHQWFQGMIASNEPVEAWMDEGINTYYEGRGMEDGFGPYAIRLFGYELSQLDMLRGGLDGGSYRDPMVAPAWKYLSGGSYALNAYQRPGLMLRHLEGLLGEATFARAMRTFFQRYRFTHPDSRDFKRTIEEVSGRDLGWFFSQAMHSTRTLDYSVRSLRVRRIREPRGVFWQGGERVERGMEDEGNGDDDEDAAGGDEVEDDDETAEWASTVVVFREGEFIHPVEVELRLDDGRSLRRTWDGDRRWVSYTVRGPAKVVSAEVDPDHVMALDANRLNNSRTERARLTPATAFAADVLHWIQALFSAAAVLG